RLVPDQGAHGARCVGAAVAQQRHSEGLARRTFRRRAARADPARRLRPHRRQPALEACRRACDAAAGACGCPLREKRWRPPPRLARRRKVVSPLFHSPGLAYFDRVGFDVPPPVGAGGVTEAVRPLLSPFVNVRPSRRAVEVGGGATTGRGVSRWPWQVRSSSSMPSAATVSLTRTTVAVTCSYTSPLSNGPGSNRWPRGSASPSTSSPTRRGRARRPSTSLSPADQRTRSPPNCSRRKPPRVHGGHRSPCTLCCSRVDAAQLSRLAFRPQSADRRERAWARSRAHA